MLKHFKDLTPDTILNTVALCPNCHKRMHIVNSEVDRSKLKGINQP